MDRKKSTQKVLMVFITFLVGASVIVACGDRGNNNSDTSDNKDVGISPGTEQSMDNQRRNENTTTAEEETFEASLEGSNEVPEVDTEASGSATVTLRGDSIHVKGDFSDLSADYTASHIHMGAEDENGNPIITLEPSVGNNKRSGSWNASYQLDSQQVNALKNDSLYINVHTKAHKPGEIRGQLTSGML